MPFKKRNQFWLQSPCSDNTEGYITAFEITLTSVSYMEELRDLTEKRLGLVILGSKGYTEKILFEDMLEQVIDLISLKPSNYKRNRPENIRQIIFHFRKKVETVFSQLSEQLNTEKMLAKSIRGLQTQLQNKLLEHNLCIAFNRIFSGAYDIGKIKHLIF